MNKKTVTLICCGIGVFIFFSFRTTVVVREQERWIAPSWTDTLKSPFVFTDSQILEGGKIYNTFCLSCHGKTGQGDGAAGMAFPVKPADFHQEVVTDQSDGALFWKLSKGRGGMPGYEEALSEEKRWQLIGYIRQFSNNKSVGVTSSQSESFLNFNDFEIDHKNPSQYFSLPDKVTNAVESESQIFMVDTVVSDLIRPWSMAFLPDQTLLITERAGNLLRVRNGKVQECSTGGNVPKGLRDVDLHPDFHENGLIYISYYIEPAEEEGGYTVLMRARLKDNSLTNNEILYKAGPFKEGGETYGSRIAFDEAGYLYFTVGQRTIDERHRWKTVQDLSNPSGKVMRFTADGSIPSDNPFVKTPGALPEIYTYGHRQPQGLMRHPETGEIWLTEHGEMGGSELNLIRSGLNYGWPEVTYSLNYDGTIISKDTVREGMESPVHYWTPSLAPSDFDFVNGDQYPGWSGDLFVGAMVQNRLNRSKFKNGDIVHDEKLLEGIGRIRDVKFGPDGFLYIMTEDTGLIVRLIPVRKN